MHHSEIKEVNLEHCGAAAFICVTEIILFYWKQRNSGNGVKTIESKRKTAAIYLVGEI